MLNFTGILIASPKFQWLHMGLGVHARVAVRCCPVPKELTALTLIISNVYQTLMAVEDKECFPLKLLKHNRKGRNIQKEVRKIRGRKVQ